MKQLFTSESVTEGHPDKVCDHIADAILDEYIRQDTYSRVAIEILATAGLMIVAGEVTSNAHVDIPRVVRQVVQDIGYGGSYSGLDLERCKLITSLHEQSPDIAMGVVRGDSIGAGDQGLMFGYACDETEELMPMPIMLANKLCMRLAELRKKGIIPWLMPDGKSQVTVEYDGEGVVKGVKAIVLSAQHAPDVDIETVRKELMDKVILPVCNELVDSSTKFYINPTGRFVIGGPAGDTGLTGRKVIVDTYGGACKHGGGAFSGKDPTKVDRSASYMMRYIAKNIVASGLARRCELQVAYAIGVAEPIALYVNTFNTSKVSDEELSQHIMRNFNLTPAGIIDFLQLRRPIYRKTSVYGHFGRNEPEFTWERLDSVDIFKRLTV
ncbi:MAG: methionine adenosyltransferase [Candidatus Nitrosocaldus sp.]